MGKKQERQEARQIANRMADQGKSAAQIAQRIENKTNVSSSAAQNIASRASSPVSGPSIAGVSIGKKLGAGEVQRLLNAGLTQQQIQNRAGNKDIRISSGAKASLIPSLPTILDDTSPGPGDDDDSVLTEDDSVLTEDDSVSTEDDEEQIPFGEYDLYPDVLRNQAIIEAERIRQAGATERLKYEVDNKIPQIQAEAKGKLDLQAIVNAGYKNIANIERGSDMVRNITSMFSF